MRTQMAALAGLTGTLTCIVRNSVAWLVGASLCLSVSGLSAQQTPTDPQAKAKQARAAKAARRANDQANAEQSVPAPTLADVSYGPDASNKIDFWKATSPGPSPLVVFIHGGGFRGGDKRAHNPSLLKACL